MVSLAPLENIDLAAIYFAPINEVGTIGRGNKEKEPLDKQKQRFQNSNMASGILVIALPARRPVVPTAIWVRWSVTKLSN